MHICDLNSFSRSSFTKLVKKFSCSSHPELVDYLKRFAFQHHKDGVFQTYLLVNDGKCLAYISFVMTEISNENSILRSQLHISSSNNYPIPSLKITRLCVSDEFMCKGNGKILIMFAQILAYEQQIRVGCRAILVDAKASALTFYEKLEFKRLISENNETIPMFFEIESLGGRYEISSSPSKLEMLQAFIDFSSEFNLSAIKTTFEELLRTIES